jgi:phosphoesterase RecJ-like protein
MNINIETPQNDVLIISQIADSIKHAKNAYITMHTRPDGDAIGSSLALHKILTDQGLKVDIIAPTEVPAIYSFLKGVEIITTEFPDEKRDLGFVVDCSDKNRLENRCDILENVVEIINIDHHQLNREFGTINYIRPDYSSTCELIFNMAMEMGIEIDHDFAMYIYVGILTDTNKFQEQNTTPHCHMISANLISNYISPVEVTSRIYGNRELNILNLISKAIENLNISSSKKIGYIVLHPELLEQLGVRNEDLEGVINYARNIKGVEVGILFRKIPKLDGIKVSLRSKGKVDVSKVARRFGGGGHHNAAGCLIPGDFKDATETIINIIDSELNTAI